MDKKIAPYLSFLFTILISCTTSYPQLLLDDGLHLLPQNDEAETISPPIAMTLGGTLQPIQVFALLTQNSHSADDTRGQADYLKHDSLHRLLFNHTLYPTTEDTAATTNPFSLPDSTNFYNKAFPLWKYNFYAYQASTAADSNSLRATDDNRLLINLQLDGTQDILHAFAFPPDDSLADIAFSAYTARRGIHPSFRPNHLLSQFQFHVQRAQPATDDDENQPVPIVRSLIIETTYKGILTIANDSWTYQHYQDSLASGFPAYWQSETCGLAVSGIDSVAVPPAQTLPLGGSVMLPPQPTLQLTLTIDYVQAETGIPLSQGEKLSCTVRSTPDAAHPSSFLPGYRYIITLTLRGKQTVDYGVTLKNWDQAEDIDIDMKI